jgi:hypothetical protein
VRLEARPAILVERIVEREPPSWSGRDGLREHAQELAASMPSLSGVDPVLRTEGERAEAVAARICAARPDRLLTAGRVELDPARQRPGALGTARFAHAAVRRRARPNRRGPRIRAGTDAAATTRHPESG